MCLNRTYKTHKTNRTRHVLFVLFVLWVLFRHSARHVFLGVACVSPLDPGTPGASQFLCVAWAAVLGAPPGTLEFLGTPEQDQQDLQDPHDVPDSCVSCPGTLQDMCSWAWPV